VCLLEQSALQQVNQFTHPSQEHRCTRTSGKLDRHLPNNWIILTQTSPASRVALTQFS
jgi:hypothetical protein